MTRTVGSTVIDAPLHDVWALLRDFGGLTSWYSGAASCEIADDKRGDQIGAIRMVGLPGGVGTVGERLTGMSDQDHALTYTIEVATDLGAVQAARGTFGRLQLFEITHGGGGTFVRWSHDYEVTGGDAQVLVGFMDGIYATFFKDLDAAFAQ